MRPVGHALYTISVRMGLALLALMSSTDAFIPALPCPRVPGMPVASSPVRSVEITAMSSGRRGGRPRTGPIGRGRGPQHGQTPRFKEPDTLSMEDFMKMANRLDNEDGVQGPARARSTLQSDMPSGGRADMSSDFSRDEASDERRLSPRERRERDLLASGRRYCNNISYGGGLLISRSIQTHVEHDSTASHANNPNGRLCSSYTPHSGRLCSPA